MKHSIKTGFYFGLTSGIITTLGLIVGLDSGTHSKPVVLGGILTIAIADAFSDALGIHISQEADPKNTSRQVWFSTISTWISKFIFALTFTIPVLLFDLSTAIVVSVAWGIVLLSSVNYYMAIKQNKNPWKVVGEHILIAVVVVIATYFIGAWISSVFWG